MRIAYIDQTRALAILLVVWIHAWDTFIIPSDFVTSSLGWAIYQLAHIIGRYGVPLFVMITGALVLDREYPNLGVVLVKKIPKFLAVLIIASIIYAILVRVLFDQSFASILTKFLTGNPIGAYHLWYMYMLIGLYLSLPFIARLLGTLSEHEVRYLIVLSLILVLTPWTLSSANLGLSYYVSSSFFVSTYPLYAITGYWLHKYNGLGSINLSLRYCIFVLLIVGTVLAKIVIDYVPDTPIPADGITWYDSIFIFTSSCILFSLLRDTAWDHLRHNRAIKVLSATSFSIYIWHLVAVHLAVYINGYMGINPFFMVLFTMSMGLVCGITLYGVLYKSRVDWLVK